MLLFNKKVSFNWFFLFPLLFIFELILGYSGKMLVVANIPIRMVLFVLTLISLYFFLFYYLYKNKYGLLKIKFDKSLLGSFNLVDWSILSLFISIIFFATIVPYFLGDGISLALKEAFSPCLVLSLFFPVHYFLKFNLISLEKLEKYIYYLVFVFSCIHIFLYIGQTLNSKFIESYFNFWKTIFFGTSTLPTIMLGHLGSPRVFFPNSIFIIFGIYIFLKNINKLKIFDYFIYFVNITAVLTTMTKSLWLGMEFGLILYFVCYLIKQIINKNFKNVFKVIFLFLGTILFLVVLNLTVFNNTLGTHFSSTFANSEYNYDEKSDYYKDILKNKGEKYVKDREGSVISNDIKIKQSKALIKKWFESPIIGFGYGSYIKNFIRSADNPFSYEMTFFALLMKTGVVGILVWLFVIVALIVTKFKNSKNNREDFFAWLFLSVSFGILVQTNPLLFNSVGMSLLLLIAFETINYKKIRKEV